MATPQEQLQQAVGDSVTVVTGALSTLKGMDDSPLATMALVSTLLAFAELLAEGLPKEAGPDVLELQKVITTELRKR